MTITHTAKVLGQSNPSATTLTDVYTVPASTETTISSIVACNRSGTATTIRIAIAVDGASDSNEQYLYYDLPLPGNETFVATSGWTVDAGDVVRVYAEDATVSFSLFGIEKDTS